MLSRRTVAKIGAVVAVLVVATIGGAGALVATGVLQQPTVESVQTEWGAVTTETAEIRTDVVVHNPNAVGVPGVMDLSYRATLNDVVLASDAREGVGLSPGNNSINLSTEMRNDRIADWWVTHVNGGERSTLDVTANVSAPGFSRSIPVQSSTIETDVAGSFGSDETRTVTMRNESILTVSDTQVDWREADAETTPLAFSANLTNEHDYPVTIDAVGYEVRMNDVTLGNGSVEDGVAIGPGEHGQLDVTADLQTEQFAAWWPTHLERGERSNITVVLHGYVEEDGERKRLPFDLLRQERSLETDLLDGGGTSVTAVESPGDAPSFEPLAIGETTREWGAVTDETTEIRTRTTVLNPNDDPALADLLSLSLADETTINGVPVASGNSTADLGRGTTAVEHVSVMDNGAVPEWWARHVNNGEQSTTVTRPDARLSMGVTSFDVAAPNQTGTHETDMLAGFDSPGSETVSIDDRDALTVSGTTAEWGNATPAAAPIEVEVTLENENTRAPATVSAVDYTATLNDVVLANDTAPESYTLAPGEERTVTFTMVLNNSRMADWWPTHVRNGEVSELSFDTAVTVESAGETRTVRLDALSHDSTVETDVLGTG